MNSMVFPFALYITGLWLLVLTFVVLLVVRQLGLITIQLSQPQKVDFDVDEDGAEIGSEVPEEVEIILSEFAYSAPLFVIFLSSSCVPCRELARELGKNRFSKGLIVLIAGREQLADAIVELLPEGLTIVRDPVATQIAESMQIHSTPFMMKIEDGVLKEKQYVGQFSQLQSFMDAQDYMSEEEPLLVSLQH